ncbi:hypothetical protein ElyMa_005995200 [Elysia marginata]|uniref:Cytochrome b561 domain-containing protein n=1 Tax=Elysia marginata TaxID=1093978 RepID=A0AAV4GFL1_9GAST|nr:hypothetical protein ElyMa_005995200 [Elysia marginata]
MAALEQGEPTSLGSEFCTIQLHSTPVDIDGGTPAKPKTIAAACLPNRWNFYVGIALTLGGIVAFTAGACSSEWIVLEDDGHGVTAPYRSRLLARVGPWEGCTHSGHCDVLWKIVPGVGEKHKITVRGVQAMLVMSMVVYLSGAVVIFLNLAGIRLTKTSCLRKILRVAVPEFHISIAAVAAILSMLLMGLVKQRILPHRVQTIHPGWAFIVCLLAILATVSGAMLMTLHRHLVPVKTTLISKAVSSAVGRWRRRRKGGGEGGRNKIRWRRRVGRRGSIPHGPLDESGIRVSIVGSGGGERGDTERREREEHLGGKDIDFDKGAGDGGTSGDKNTSNCSAFNDASVSQIGIEGVAAAVTFSPSHAALSADEDSSDPCNDTTKEQGGEKYNNNIAIPRPRPQGNRGVISESIAQRLSETHADWRELRPMADIDFREVNEAANSSPLSTRLSDQTASSSGVYRGQAAALEAPLTDEVSEV